MAIKRSLSPITGLRFPTLKGIEKESLRITCWGRIAQTPHPRALGSPLTHPFITTDYSEALLELITPPVGEGASPLPFLEKLHRFVYQALPSDELLLATSMPIGFRENGEIPIARYGTSHLGLLKHIYRVGLEHRYGRAMQTIAGIHFNFSVADGAWAQLRELFPELAPLEERAFRSHLYLGQIRNLNRLGWLILYLFGASPAVDADFLRCRNLRPQGLLPLDRETLYAPHATSLRMSEIGYFSPVQAKLAIDLNSLEGYIESLLAATQTPYPPYQKIGIRQGDRYLQLSTSLLQVEDELYTPFRPKAHPRSGERLLCRLAKEGISYIEIRAIDLDPFLPLGIDEEGIRFLELLALYALLLPSPPLTVRERRQIEANLLETAWRGRHPHCRLWREGERILLKDWAEALFEELSRLVDRLDNGSPYRSGLTRLYERVCHPERTPSARLLDDLERRKISFRQFALERSARHALEFRQGDLSPEEQARLEREAELSHQKQRLLEEESRAFPFEQFLARFLKDPCWPDSLGKPSTAGGTPKAH